MHDLRLSHVFVIKVSITKIAPENAFQKKSPLGPKIEITLRPLGGMQGEYLLNRTTITCEAAASFS